MPDPLTRLSPQQPARLDRIVRRLLAKRAEDRYQSAAELRRELSTLQESGLGFWERPVTRFFRR